MKSNKQTVRAANDNAGGPQETTATLEDVVTLMAKAYVAELKKKERQG